MKAIAILFAAALVLMPAATFAKAAPQHDWSRTVAATPAGGFKMGDPGAKVRLVEYGSLACPHCRAFEQTGYAPLVRDYVRTGKVSYEFRNLLLNAPDMAASLLAHCAGPVRFFPMAKAIFDSQPQWFDKIDALTGAQQSEMDKMTDSARMVRLAEVGGFIQIAGRFGMPPAKARQCLGDARGLERLVEGTRAAENAGVEGTPTFVINGQVAGVTTWDDLRPKLDAAIAAKR